MQTHNTKPEEGKEPNAFRFMQKKIGENLWRFPQGYSQSTIFEFMEEFAQLSPSSTAPQGEETYTRSEVEGLLNKFCNEVMVGQSAGTIPKHSNGIAQYIIDNF